MPLITWKLTNGRFITRRGEGAQQVFATLNQEDRMDITLNCLSVYELMDDEPMESRLAAIPNKMRDELDAFGDI